jgi:hypothetical protein
MCGGGWERSADRTTRMKSACITIPIFIRPETGRKASSDSREQFFTAASDSLNWWVP